MSNIKVYLSQAFTKRSVVLLHSVTVDETENQNFDEA